MNIGQRIVAKLKGFFTRKRQPEIFPKINPRQKLSITEDDFKRWVEKHFVPRKNYRPRMPKLTGARLDRTIEACSPKHLTRLSKGAQLTWNGQ